MAIAAAHAIADFANNRGISPDNIIPKMTETDVFPTVATEVAMQAIREGLAKICLTKEEVYRQTKNDIEQAHQIIDVLSRQGLIKPMDMNLAEKALLEAIEEIKSK